MVNLIEDESKNSYTIRSDLMKNGDILQCKEDNDMKVLKKGDIIILVKKSFTNNCFKKK